MILGVTNIGALNINLEEPRILIMATSSHSLYYTAYPWNYGRQQRNITVI